MTLRVLNWRWIIQDISGSVSFLYNIYFYHCWRQDNRLDASRNGASMKTSFNKSRIHKVYRMYSIYLSIASNYCSCINKGKSVPEPRATCNTWISDSSTVGSCSIFLYSQENEYEHLCASWTQDFLFPILLGKDCLGYFLCEEVYSESVVPLHY